MATTDGPGPFGVLLQQYRATAALSQEELAERAGLSRRGISDLERGQRRSPHPATIRRLAEALGLGPSERGALVAAARRNLQLAGMHSLPSTPSPLIGRVAEMASLRQRMTPTVRLLTLTGPGGIGKTRLALALAAEQRTQFADGVYFVPLATVLDPALVQSTIVERVGIREAGRRPPREALREHLGDKRVLLLLDNFEHLLPAAPVVADLLAACPDLRVLVTSRAALRIAGEYEYAVLPLELPVAEPITARGLAEVAAVNLFVERARAVNSRFKLTDQNAPAIAAICRRLDGLPLAIELAAARSRVLSAEVLLARLDRRLPLLTSHSRDLPARQQTVRATLAWSFDLLAPAEQALFRRLAVFVGGWTVEAAEAVCAFDAGERVGVLDGLEALASHSQVQSDGQRFAMLETIREFAQEALQRSGEQSQVEERHAAFFMALANEAVRHLEGPEELTWLDQVEREHANLRAAGVWSARVGNVDWGPGRGDGLPLRRFVRELLSRA